MSYMKVMGSVAAAATALALSAGAYGDPGNSPNGAPGPAGNPNQPAAQPQANGPQGPAGNQGNSDAAKAKTHGKSNASHGRSAAPHGNSGANQGKSLAKGHAKNQTQSHTNPTPGTPRKGGREDRPADKETICHATKSTTNPYVAITVSLNAIKNGHGPADDPHHHAGSWKDIIPAPDQNAKDGGCPTTAPAAQQSEQKPTANTAEQAKFVAPAAEVATTAPAEQAVLGARAAGTAPATPGASKVLGASASGTTAPKAAVAARAAGDEKGSLPFTGYQLAIVLIAAAAALLGGFALRRAAGASRS
jgi:hypothetical protein